MSNGYYTVDQVAEMLHMHVKTVRRYIREGKLPAAKVGKQWRVTGHDLSVFMEGERPASDFKQISAAENFANDSSQANAQNDKIPLPKIQVSTVVETVYETQTQVERITNTLTAVMQTKDPSYGNSTLNVQVLPSQRKIRVLLWGTIPFVESMLGCIRTLVEE